MKLQIKQRDRKALILLVLALMIYEAANLLIIPSYDRMAAARDLATEKEAQLRRYRRAQLRKGQYADLLKTASTRVLQSESAVIRAPNLSSASAEFQSLIEDVASKVGLLPGQRSVGAAKRLNEFYAEMPMTLSFESTPGQVVSFLTNLRALPRFVSVRSLQILPTEVVTELPKGAALTKIVHVNLTLVAPIPAELVKTENGTR